MVAHFNFSSLIFVLFSFFCFKIFFKFIIWEFLIFYYLSLPQLFQVLPSHPYLLNFISCLSLHLPPSFSVCLCVLVWFLKKLSTVCVGQVLLSLDLPWSVIDITSVTPLKEIDSSLLSSNKIPVTPQLGVGIHTHLPSFMLEFCLAGTFADPVYAATVPVSLYVHLP